ncbi:MAG: NifB/NifX family molybdenum-iron cluster-binding protein [Halothermotrichaceae bacterium]
MKIAVPSQGEIVAQHFGHCSHFAIFDVEGNEIKNKDVIANPGHQPGFLPKFLNKQGAEIVLAGGIGSRAVKLFEENGIKVVSGCKGQVDDAVKLYLNDELETEDNTCDH